MKTKKFAKVPDDSVRLVFRCPECGDRETIQPGDGLVTDGTPHCADCGCDMDYVRVEVIETK